MTATAKQVNFIKTLISKNTQYAEDAHLRAYQSIDFGKIEVMDSNTASKFIDALQRTTISKFASFDLGEVANAYFKLFATSEGLAHRLRHIVNDDNIIAVVAYIETMERTREAAEELISMIEAGKFEDNVEFETMWGFEPRTPAQMRDQDDYEVRIVGDELRWYADLDEDDADMSIEHRTDETWVRSLFENKKYMVMGVRKQREATNS